MQILHLKDDLDDYHEKRAAKHGYLYFKIRKFGKYYDLYEAKSIATGHMCTLDSRYVEET